jgi:hypothetical protein
VLTVGGNLIRVDADGDRLKQVKSRRHTREESVSGLLSPPAKEELTLRQEARERRTA